jgi:hypothetical protein
VKRCYLIGRTKRGTIIETKKHSINITKKPLEGIVKIIEDGYADVMNQNENKYCKTSYVYKEGQ